MSGPQPSGRRRHGQPGGQQPPRARRSARGYGPKGRDSAPADENPTETLWLGDESTGASRRDSHAGDLFEDAHAGGHERGHPFDDERRAAEHADDGYVDDGYYDDGYYDDNDEERADPVYYDDERDEPPRPRRRGRRAFGWVAALAVIVLLAAGAYFGVRELLGFGYDDYEGAGEKDVVIHVAEGDTTGIIGRTLAEADVVASAEAFVAASEDNTKIRTVQPGYYRMKTQASGEHAVRRIVSDESRVGYFQIEPGRQLAKVSLPDDSTIDGVLQRLSEASCAELGGEDTCVSVADLTEAIENTDLAKLGVPEWARKGAAEGKSLHKLEGLIAPGDYNVRPGSSAVELLQQVMEKSASRLQAAGLPDSTDRLDPYEVLITASVIQREGITEDFAKISRVIHNRLAADMQLQMDSTINYVNETQSIRTTKKQRAEQGPYNTYRNQGLPPTPISSPGTEAIEAALHPAEGDWKYFVKCESDGQSCFTNSYAEHKREVADAQERGVY